MKQKIYILIIILFSNVVSFGQGLNWSWAKSAGGDYSDQCDGVATDLNGNVYVTGSFYSSTINFDTCTLTNTVNNYGDIFVTKYNSNGNVLWAKSAGGSSLDFGRSITTDRLGNVYITGEFYSPTITVGAYTLTNAGQTDIFIAKYDSLGNVLWAKQFGGSAYDKGESITTDTIGNIYITGGFYSTNIIFGTDTLTNASVPGSRDAFVIKCSPFGNILWAQSIGGSEDDVTSSITADLTGNVYLTGKFESPNVIIGNDTLTNNGGVLSHYDIFIAKYDSAGNALWARSAGGSDADFGLSVKTDATGNVFFTGAFYSPTITLGTNILNNVGGADIFIAKYDFLGNLIWAKREGGDLYDFGRGITISSDGNIYLTGTFRNTTLAIGNYTLTNSNTGTDDIFVVKYNTSGNVLGVCNAGGSNMDYAFSIASDAFGNIYLSGSFSSPNITFGGTILTLSNNAGNGSPNVFIAKLDNPTNINAVKKETYFNVFPNPTSSNINVSFSQQNNTSIAINLVDIQGNVIFKENKSQSIGIYKSTIDLRNQAKGIYFLQIITTTEIVTRKIILN